MMVWRTAIIGGCFFFFSSYSSESSQPNSARLDSARTTPPLSARDLPTEHSPCLIHDTIEYTFVPTINNGCFCDDHEYHCANCCATDTQYTRSVKQCLQCEYRSSNFPDYLNGERFSAPGERETELLIAVYLGELTKVQSLLKSEVNVNCRIFRFWHGGRMLNTGETPLHISAAADPEITDALLEHEKINPNIIAMSNGLTPLGEAIAGIEDGNRSNGVRLRIIKKLLEKGADVNLHSGLQLPPLPLALGTSFGRAHVARLLLERSTRPNHGNPLARCLKLLQSIRSTPENNASARLRCTEEIKVITVLIEEFKRRGAHENICEGMPQLNGTQIASSSPRLASPGRKKLSESAPIEGAVPPATASRRNSLSALGKQVVISEAARREQASSPGRNETKAPVQSSEIASPVTAPVAPITLNTAVPTSSAPPHYVYVPTFVPVPALRLNLVNPEIGAGTTSVKSPAIEQKNESDSSPKQENETNKECAPHHLFTYSHITEGRPCLKPEHCPWCCPGTKPITVIQCRDCKFHYPPHHTKLYSMPTADEKEFIHAAILGNQTTVGDYLRAGGNPNATAFGIHVKTGSRIELYSGTENRMKHQEIIFNDGETALHGACRAAQLAIVELLLAHPGTDVNAESLTHSTPVQEAVNCIILDGNTPYSGRIQSILSLLFDKKRKANPEIHQRGEPTALAQAFSEEETYLKLVPLLIVTGNARLDHQNVKERYSGQETDPKNFLSYSPRFTLVSQEIPQASETTPALPTPPSSARKPEEKTPRTIASTASPAASPRKQPATQSPRTNGQKPPARPSSARRAVEKVGAFGEALVAAVTPRSAPLPTTPPTTARTNQSPKRIESESLISDDNLPANQKSTNYDLLHKGKYPSKTLEGHPVDPIEKEKETEEK